MAGSVEHICVLLQQRWETNQTVSRRLRGCHCTPEVQSLGSGSRGPATPGLRSGRWAHTEGFTVWRNGLPRGSHGFPGTVSGVPRRRPDPSCPVKSEVWGAGCAGQVDPSPPYLSVLLRTLPQPLS